MSDRNLYIIGGCYGAEKTTASFTILPDIINCKEFVNADEIAKGLSPFQPETVAFEAERIMLTRINDLLKNKQTFSFETTLATKSYKSKILEAKKNGYTVTLLYFWLDNIDLAKERVKVRVSEGGHHIEPEIIERRYKKGIINLFDIYLPVVNGCLVFDNSFGEQELIAKKNVLEQIHIFNKNKFNSIKIQYDYFKRTK
jgi:predicted ABC-type ATPase